MICEVKQPNVTGDVVTENFWQPKLGFLACVAWPDIGSSNSHPLDSKQHYFLQPLDVSLHIESKVMWEDEWMHNIAINCHLPKHHDLDRVFGIYQYKYGSILRLMPKHSEIFLLECPACVPSSMACCFQISGGVNCVMVLLTSQIVSNWF